MKSRHKISRKLFIGVSLGALSTPALAAVAVPYKDPKVKPSEKQTLRLELGSDELAFWDIDMKWIVERGTFTIYDGASSAHLKSTSLPVQNT